MALNLPVSGVVDLSGGEDYQALPEIEAVLLVVARRARRPLVTGTTSDWIGWSDGVVWLGAVAGARPVGAERGLGMRGSTY